MRVHIQKNRCRTTVAEPTWGNASGTALYRGSGRLFRPRPGRLERTCINEGGLSVSCIDGDERRRLRLAPRRFGLVDVGGAGEPGDRDGADIGDREVGVQRLVKDDRMR